MAGGCGLIVARESVRDVRETSVIEKRCVLRGSVFDMLYFVISTPVILNGGYIYAMSSLYAVHINQPNGKGAERGAGLCKRHAPHVAPFLNRIHKKGVDTLAIVCKTKAARYRFCFGVFRHRVQNTITTHPESRRAVDRVCFCVCNSPANCVQYTRHSIDIQRTS